MSVSPTMALPCRAASAAAGLPRVRSGPAATVLVPGTGRARDGVVVAAIDDDGNASQIIAYARARSARLRVPLRVAHVWAGRGTGPGGLRMPRQERAGYADRLLAAAVHDFVPAGERLAAERHILHDDDTAHALTDLSRDAALLVVALNSDPTASDILPGHTTRGLVGHTACPLAILPAAWRSATAPGW
jgi:hypothetical protein